MQRRDLIVEVLAALVEAHVGAADDRARGVDIETVSLPLGLGKIRRGLQEIQHAARIAVRRGQQQLARGRLELEPQRAQAPLLIGERAVEELGRGPPASSGFSTYTRARDKSALLTSKEGFSVVAPTKMSVPSST